MNILKLLGIVVGIHVAAYLVIAQPGCRSTAAKPAPAVTAAPPMSAPADSASPATLVTPVADESAPALNLSFGGADRFAPTRPGAEPPPETATPAKAYTVQKGDSFYTIARKNGITVAELTAANNLAPNAAIRPGQKLVIPGKAAAEPTSGAVRGGATASPSGATYTVKSGDTLSKIASRHHTTAGALRSANGISGDHLKIGQTLQIPGAAGTPSATRSSLPPPPAASPVSTPSASPAPAGSGVHTVAVGESAESISRKYQISVGELVRANQITDPRKIRVGQVLTIPGSGAAKAARPAPSLVPDSAPARVPASAPVIGPRVTTPEPEVEATPVAPVDAPVVPVDEAPPAVPVPQID